MLKKIYNNSGTVLFIVILLIILLLTPYTLFKNEHVLKVNNSNRSTVNGMLKDNEYYIKNKANIKITKITLSYGVLRFRLYFKNL